MATLTNTQIISPISPPAQVRSFDARRDMQPVADLVELCFSETLDSDGRRYLDHMRSNAQNEGLMNLAGFAADWASMPFSGFVWEEAGRLVGNVSLIPYFMNRRRFYLIANVAVHPDFRRRGIARSLTLQAVEQVRRRGCPAVWLQVREDNPAAIQLYRSLGFSEQARRTTWNSRLEPASHEAAGSVTFSAPRAHLWEMQRAWYVQNYPAELSWHLAFNLRTLQPGLWGGIYRFLTNETVQQWAAWQDGRLQGLAAWQADGTHPDAIWLAAPPDTRGEVIHALLLHARRQLGWRRPLMLEYPAHRFDEAILTAGFQERQTLIWMSLSLENAR